MKKVTVQNSFYPDGTELDLPALGRVVNGEAKEVDDSQVQAWIDLGYEWPEKGNLTLKIPTPPVAQKDLEPDAIMELTDEEMDTLADNKKENS